MTSVSLQIFIPHENGLVQDGIVNTFAFQGPGSASSIATTAAARLLTFYNTDYAGHHLSEYMSPSLVGASGRIKAYNINDPEPRVPVLDAAFALNIPSASGSSFPNEVAFCISFSALEVSGVPSARRRGRIYLGPLNTTAGAAISGGDSRPAPALIATAVAASTALAQASTSDAIWSVWSRKNAELYTVSKGWCDNAWDVQRRRGIDPSARTSWVRVTP